MRRRFPLLIGFSGLAIVLGSYVALAHRIVGAVAESWYQSVERRLVDDRQKLIPPEGSRWFGMYRPELPWNYTRFRAIGDQLGVKPRVVAWYQSWGDGEDAEFKSEATANALAAGLIPMVTWEPWLSAFGSRSVNDPRGSLAYVTQGRFDDYIRRWARAAVDAGGPIFLRPLHEMGNSWYSWSTAYDNSPALVAEAWRHIVNIFRQEGARNVAFVWTPYTSDDIAAWPGADWVDWIGVDIFNYGTLAEDDGWTDFRHLLGKQLNPLPDWGKPIMIAEMGCSGFGGDRDEWWTNAFRDLGDGAFPDVKAVVVFDNPAHQANSTSVTVDWGFTHSSELFPMLRPLAADAGFAEPRSPSAGRAPLSALPSPHAANDSRVIPGAH